MERTHGIDPIILAHAREMRHPQTSAEATVWSALRNRKCSYKFRRQHPVDMFIADFYCAAGRLLIEIDGDSHFELGQQEYDKARTEYPQKLGYKVIRFTNDDVRYNMNAVVVEILRIVESRIVELKQEKITRLSPHPSPPPAGERGQE